MVASVTEKIKYILIKTYISIYLLNKLFYFYRYLKVCMMLTNYVNK